MSIIWNTDDCQVKLYETACLVCLLIWEYIFTKIKKSSTLRFQQARWGCRRWRHSWRKHLSPRPPPRPPHLPLARGRATSWSRTLGRWCTLVSLKIQYPVLAVTLLTSLTPTQARKLGFTDKKFNSNTVFYPKKKTLCTENIITIFFIKLLNRENTIIIQYQLSSLENLKPFFNTKLK